MLHKSSSITICPRQYAPRTCDFDAIKRNNRSVPVDFTADLTQDFTGADITELCQRAAKAAIRESITAEEERRRLAGDDENAAMDADEVQDPVPEI